ncbi:MAG TPA: MarR family winged helix-turn-helix transcriptional regulator [Stellaceae bacterium]|nr:MarR family winged helix-turn-helix transcriptional regulator [Stellaceae bacterium]
MGRRVEAFALDRFAPLRLPLLANRLTRMMGRACRPLGLSAPAWRVIALLGETGALPIRQVRARSGIDKARLSRVTSQLCAQGFVELQATAGDRRQLSLVLTPRGREVRRDLMRLLIDLQRMLLRDIGSEEYQVFERVLDSLESKIKAPEFAGTDTIAPAAADCGA